jgi:hypothetical protein
MQPIFRSHAFPWWMTLFTIDPVFLEKSILVSVPAQAKGTKKFRNGWENAIVRSFRSRSRFGKPYKLCDRCFWDGCFWRLPF